jgi:hypothetical protein
MENPLQEIQIRTPTTTYRKKSSRRQTLCPDTIKATSTKLREQPEFMCPSCGPAFITFPGAHGEQVCGDCDAVVTEVFYDSENTTPNLSNKKKSPFTVKKKLEKVIEVDFSTPLSMDSSLLSYRMGLKVNGQFSLAKFAVVEDAQALDIVLTSIDNTTTATETISLLELCNTGILDNSTTSLDGLNEAWFHQHADVICITAFRDVTNAENTSVNANEDKKIQKVVDFDDETNGNDVDNSVNTENLVLIETLKKEKIEMEMQHQEIIQDLTLNAEEIKRCELESLRESLENEWMEKLDEEIQQTQKNYEFKIQEMKQNDDSQFNILKENSEKEIETLNVEIKKLQSEFEQKETEIEKKHTTEMNALRFDVTSNLKSEFEAREKKINDSHMKEIENMQKERVIYAKEMASKHAEEMAQLRLEMENVMKTKQSETGSKLETCLKAERLKAENEMKEMEQKMKIQMQEFQTSHSYELTALKAKFEAAAEEAESKHGSEITELKDEVDTLKGQTIVFKSQFNTCSGENTELVEQIKALNVKIFEQNDSVEKFTNLISKFEEEKKSLIESNEKLTNDMSDMAEKHTFERKSIVEKHTVDMKSLKDELQQNAIATATSDASKFESERINLLNELNAMKENIVTITEKNNELKDALSTATSNATTFETERDGLSIELKSLKEQVVTATELNTVLKNDIKFAQVEISNLKTKFCVMKESFEGENLKLQETIHIHEEKFKLEKSQAEAFYSEQSERISKLNKEEIQKITSIFETELEEQKVEIYDALKTKYHDDLRKCLIELENEMLQKFEMKEAKMKYESEKVISTSIEKLTSKYEQLIETLEGERESDVKSWRENFTNQEKEIETLRNIFSSEKEALKEHYEIEQKELKKLFQVELNLNKKIFDKSAENAQKEYENQMVEKDEFIDNLVNAIHEEYAFKMKTQKNEYDNKFEQFQIQSQLDNVISTIETAAMNEEKFVQKFNEMKASYEEEKNILKNDFRFVKVAMSRRKEKELNEQKMALKDSHQQQIVELSRGNEKAILSLKQSFEAEKGMWDAQHNDDIQRKCKALQDSLAVMTTTMSSEMEKAHTIAEERCKEFEARFKTFHEKEMTRIKEEHKKEIEKMKLNNGEADINAKHAEEIEKLNAEMKQQKETLENDMEDLKKRLEGEMFVMMETNNEEVAKSEQLTKTLEENNDKVEKMEEDLAEMVKVASDIEEKLTEELKTEKIKSAELEGGILKKDEVIKNMETEIIESKETKESFIKLTKDYDLMKEKLLQCEEMNKGQTEKIANFDKTLRSKIKIFDQKLKTQATEYEQKFALKDKAIKDMEKKIKDQKKKSEVFETKFKDHCKKQMGKARDMYVLEKQKVATLINEVKNVKELIKTKEKDIENLMNQNETVKRDLIKFESKYNKLEAEDKTLKASLFEKGEKITSLSAQNAELNVLCSEMMERLENVEGGEQ